MPFETMVLCAPIVGLHRLTGETALFKRFMRSKIVAATVGWLVAAYMVLVKYTTRWDVTLPEQTRALMGNGEGLIAVTWHSRFLMLNAAWKKRYQTPHVLISRSRDGQIVAYTSRFLGLKTIRGSAKTEKDTGAKGGEKAGRGIAAALKSGGCIVITPDGPRGPRQRMSLGALRLARMSGAPIVPCLFAVKNRKVMRSWDKFVLPLPFGRGRIIWGTPVTLAPDADDAQLQKVRAMLEASMNQFLSEADSDMGHVPILPAERKVI